MKFPKITICNLNIFQKKRAQSFYDNAVQDFIEQENLLYNTNYSSQTIFSSTQLHSIPPIEEITRRVTLFQDFIKAKAKNQLNTSEKFNIGHKLEDMLIKCTMSESQCANSDFKWFW